MLGYKPGYTLACTKGPKSFNVIHRRITHKDHNIAVSTVDHVVLVHRTAR